MTATKNRVGDAFSSAASRAVRRVGWDPRNELEILKPDGSGRPASVRYGYKPGRIRLVQSPELLGQLAQMETILTPADLGTPEDALDNVVASRVYLQAGAWNVCPSSAADYAEILDACADGLRSAKTPEPQVCEFTVPTASLFVASVVSGVYAVEGPDPQGFRRGWQLDQIVSSRSADTALPTYASLYANMQLRLWSDNRVLGEELRSCFSCPFDALDFETDRGVAVLLDSFEFAGATRDGLVWHEKNVRELLVDELRYNCDAWPVKAFQFAELLAPYVADRQDQRSAPPPGADRRGTSGRPSQQATARRNAVRSSLPRNGRSAANRAQVLVASLPGVPADSFGERFRTEARFRQEILQAAVGQGKSPLNFFAGPDALDAIYRSEAAEVTIESETNRRQGTAVEIACMSREPLGTQPPSLSDLDLGATRVDKDGTPVFYRKRLPITHDIAAKVETGGFPDLLFVVDSSGSMGWNPQAGAGPYDSLLRAVYSVFRFLEERGKAPYMRFAAVNFSSRTLKTPWVGYSELEVIKKLLFTHQNGGTVLDGRVLDSIAVASADRFLCLMVTDGQVSNVDGAVQAIVSMVDRGHGFVLIQIGRENPMTHALRALGVPAHVISDHTQLQGLCLRYTRQAYDPGR